MPNKLDSRKISILESATKVFAEKGFVESTISDIARAAAIADSGFYNYFKGKEDVLFNIPEHKMRLYLSGLEEQLEGIKGAENKIRKLIWYHCRYFTTHKDYTHVLLLECRSNPKFYASKAYQLIKDYSKIIIDLLEQGIREGTISNSCSPRLLRDMIMGTIDHVALNWILKDTPSPLDKAESIHDLIMNSANLRVDSKIELDPKTTKRRKIIDISTRIFAEKGYNYSRISEIAKEAEVAEGTIYEYYQSKENLLISIPEEKLRELLSYIEEASPEKKLDRMILFCFRFFNNNRDFTSVLVLMLRGNRSFYKSKSDQILGKISENIRNIILEGMKKGVFSKNVDIDTFQDLVFGTIDHIIIPWVMFKRKYDLLQIGEDASKLFINAIRA